MRDFGCHLLLMITQTLVIHTHVCSPLDIQHEDSRFSSDVVKAFEKNKSSIDRCEVNQHTVSEDTMDTSETYLLICPLELETDIETRVRLARVQSLFLIGLIERCPVVFLLAARCHCDSPESPLSAAHTTTTCVRSPPHQPVPTHTHSETSALFQPTTIPTSSSFTHTSSSSSLFHSSTMRSHRPALPHGDTLTPSFPLSPSLHPAAPPRSLSSPWETLTNKQTKRSKSSNREREMSYSKSSNRKRAMES